MSRKHFEVVRHFLKNTEWDYFQFVEIGLDRIQHGFWKYHDPEHVLHEPEQPVQRRRSATTTATSTRRSASLLELLTDDTVVLVVSDHGARRLDGGFCVNEWLVREGLLVLNQLPRAGHAVRASSTSNWEQDAGLERGGLLRPRLLQRQGARAAAASIEPADYERFRDEIKARFEATDRRRRASRWGRSSSSPRRSTATSATWPPT